MFEVNKSAGVKHNQPKSCRGLGGVWMFVITVVGYPFAVIVLFMSAWAVPKRKLTEAGLNADDVVSALEKKGWLEAVTPSEIRVPEGADLKAIEGGLRELFPKDFDKIRRILRSSSWFFEVFVRDLAGLRGREIAREWGESVVVALFFALIIRSYFFQPFRIPSGSMRMALIEGDRLFVNKLAYGPSLIPVEIRSFSAADVNTKVESSLGQFLKTRIPGFSKPKRGDVIVFRYPITRDKDFIKRLIALGGETVEIRDGKIVINDEPVTEGPLAKVYYYNQGDYGIKGRKVKVPEGYFFVLGDNSASSHDSRYWGFVPEHFLIGRADVIFFPPKRMGLIK